MSSPDRPAGQVIRVGTGEPTIQEVLQAIASETSALSRHFNQNEEFFVELASPFAVPSLPIHHDVHQSAPQQSYVESVAAVVEQIARLAPGVLRGLSYGFDPTDILKARFHSLYSLGRRRFLYLLNLDLSFRAQEHEVVSRGTNDATAEYRSRRLFLDALFVPIAGDAREDSSVFEVAQTFSQTWLGERGRGYFVQGIWIDHDLTKFFSKLFLPAGVRAYPFYPFVCRYRTICESAIDLAPPARAERLPYLEEALDFIAPAVRSIEQELRSAAFSEELAVFRELKAALPGLWHSFYPALRLRPYLNPAGMREFVVETTDG